MLLDRYRRTGADPLFGDPGRPHGTSFEGWFWRLTMPESDDVLVVVHGVSIAPDGGLWGTHALATRTQLRETYEPVSAYPADVTRIVHSAGEDAWIDARVEAPVFYGRSALGGLGAGQLVPGLSQYWHPLLLGGRARGTARVGDEEVDLDGALVYAEKNWGTAGFPEKWWWGQAFLEDGEACVSFAGGRAARLGPLALDASAIVVRVGDERVTAAVPLQRMSAEVGEHGWRLRGGGIELEGDANGTDPTPLPVPVPKERRNLDGAARQHLAGRLSLTVRRRGRLLLSAQTSLAGLEQGTTGSGLACSPMELEAFVHAVLAEDVGTGDVTTLATVPEGARARALITQKADGVLSGLAVAEAVFRATDPDVRLVREARDGELRAAPAPVLRIEGAAAGILSAERTALNLLQRLSGVATLTRAYVDAVAGTGAQVIDTRKTTPGLRALEKQAVLDGGGANHRIGLFDMVLIKENHVAAAGGIGAAVAAGRARYPSLPLEVEVTDLAELDEALDAGAPRILLDNMDPDTMREAVGRVGDRAETEASGGISLETVRAAAQTGVTYVSVGALTHSARALDLSLILEPL